MRYAIALLLGAVCAPVALAQTPPPGEAKQDEDARAAKVRDAITMIKQGNPTGGIAMLDPVLAEYDKLYPDSGPRIVCASDMTNMFIGLLAAAGARKDAVALDSTWCFALWARGFALVELGRMEEALPPLSRAAAMMPSQPQFQSELGYVHQALKQWDKSLVAYAAAAEAAQPIENEKDRNFELRRAWFGMAYAQIELGKLDDAEELLEKALKVAPGDRKILNELEYVRDARRKGKPG
jgi:tetratricopeptide (TPR) repeat protein